MVNLLPVKAHRGARLEYRVRLAIVGGLSAAAAFVALAGLLLPAFFMSRVANNATTLQSSLVNNALSQTTLTQAGQAERAAQALYLNIQSQMKYPRPSVVVGTILQVPRTGIAIESIEYGTHATSTTLRISGTATTRNDLLGYKEAMLSVPGVSGVDLPLQSLLTAQDISFTISLNYAPPSP